jgi:hypothetical protein
MSKSIITGLLSLLVAGLALAQPKPETKHVTGAVKSIAADSMVVTVDGKDWTFIVDKDTNVVAKGASHTSRKAEGASEATMITDFVKAAQTVTVDYSEMGGKFTAKEVRVK